jgi:hypothetical protein
MLSATEGAATWSAVAPTTRSQPRAASVIVWNCAATVPSIMARSCSGVGGAADGAAFPVGRSSGPMGVTGIPSPSIHSRKSGGTHSRTSLPSSLSSRASATSGWTSPRDPMVESSTRMGSSSGRGPGVVPAGVGRPREGAKFEGARGPCRKSPVGIYAVAGDEAPAAEDPLRTPRDRPDTRSEGAAP